ncbi:ParA family protein [Thalassospira marina]|uniref:Phosphonate ABC transporter ATPase n=1 Tax=Thalassospira marina TaxID=2048283 RepID=A0A2N3KD02_9PROT|nr:ParA family protein [Thalassospira marina]PKR48442.1 phosphonate ABC transporter ATPase [Thalassospira marina]
MSITIGIVSQKGGVGKSTIARLVAREYAAAGWNVKIADLDIQQGTSFNWQARRLRRAQEPAVPVERFGTVAQALKIAPQYDLFVLDGPPHATMGTLHIAEASQLVILPTGLALDDLEPGILLAHELVRKGIPANRLVFVFTRAGDSIAEEDEAKAYIRQAGYRFVDTALPEKVAYRRASDEGLALTETRFTSLNAKADAVAQSLIDIITAQQQEEEAA